MSARLEHAAVVVGVQHEDFTLSASVFCELWSSGHGFYVFRSHQLDGKKVYEEAGTYSECRAAWMSVAGNPLPHEIEGRRA